MHCVQVLHVTVLRHVTTVFSRPRAVCRGVQMLLRVRVVLHGLGGPSSFVVLVSLVFEGTCY
jgi:hypothetical protein